MTEKVQVVKYAINLSRIDDKLIEVQNFRCVYKPKISLDPSTPKNVVELFNKSKKFSDKLTSLKELVANAKALNCLVAANAEYSPNNYQCGVLFLGANKDNVPTLNLNEIDKKYIFGPIQRYF